MSFYFWWAVSCVYIGLLLLLVDLWMERFKQKWVRNLISLILIGIGTAFSIGVVFKKAPMTVDANVITIPHFTGSTFGGITWYDPKASDLRVWIRNPSSINYDEVDMVVDTDAYIIGIGQLQGLPKCEVTLSNEGQAWATFEDKTGKQHTVNPPIASTLGAGYRVLCSKFPPRTAIQLIFATTDKPNAPGITVDEVATPNNGARNPSTKVTVEGTYRAAFQTRTIKETVNVQVQK